MSWLPSALTLLRFPAAFWVAFLILRGAYGEALIWLALAGLTDSLDGLLARRMNAVSRFGAFLDPIADKTLLVTVFVTLGMGRLVPLWLVWLVLGRDALILVYAALALLIGRQRKFTPSVWGKLSTVVQIVTGLAALGSHAVQLEVLAELSGILPVVAGITTVWSGMHYAWRAFRDHS